MDLTAANSVIGTELDSPAAKHTGNIIEDGNNINYHRKILVPPGVLITTPGVVITTPGGTYNYPSKKGY